MFAWLRIIATSSIGVFNSFAGQNLPSQVPWHEERVRLANMLLAPTSGMNLSLVGLEAVIALADRFSA